MTDSDSVDPCSNQGPRTTISNGDYLMTQAPVGYPGKIVKGHYAYDHHVAWWLKTGIAVPKGYVVHHINGDRKDNSPDNLECLSNSEHVRQHQKPAKRKLVQCSVCGKSFLRRVRVLRAKEKAGSVICCSKSCAGYAGKSVGRVDHGTVGAYNRCGPPKCSLCVKAMREYYRMRRAKKRMMGL